MFQCLLGNLGFAHSASYPPPAVRCRPRGQQVRPLCIPLDDAGLDSVGRPQRALSRIDTSPTTIHFWDSLMLSKTLCDTQIYFLNFFRSSDALVDADGVFAISDKALPSRGLEFKDQGDRARELQNLAPRGAMVPAVPQADAEKNNSCKSVIFH